MNFANLLSQSFLPRFHSNIPRSTSPLSCFTPLNVTCLCRHARSRFRLDLEKKVTAAIRAVTISLIFAQNSAPLDDKYAERPFSLLTHRVSLKVAGQKAARLLAHTILSSSSPPPPAHICIFATVAQRKHKGGIKKRHVSTKCEEDFSLPAIKFTLARGSKAF